MNKKFLSVILAFLISFSIASCSVVLPEEPQMTESAEEVSGDFAVHYIDVGQADSSLIICGDATMLIDGGNAEDSSLVVTYLNKLGITHLDYMVCTHAHEDHVGGLSGPLNTVTVGTVYAPYTESDIKAYTSFKKAALKQVSEIKVPDVGETIELGESKIVFLGPVTENYEDLNDTSIVLKAKFGETAFLFTGDATREAEADIINSGADLSADVFKVGHHGSESSNSYAFLREIMPEYAVISVGAGNSYGHPHDEVLSRLEDADVTVYRTDLQGDIIATSDGKNITFKTVKHKNSVQQTVQTTVSEDGYIGNKNSKKFHLPVCNALPAEKNRVYFENREEAIQASYEPCGGCKP